MGAFFSLQCRDSNPQVLAPLAEDHRTKSIANQGIAVLYPVHSTPKPNRRGCGRTGFESRRRGGVAGTTRAATKTMLIRAADGTSLPETPRRPARSAQS